MDGLASAAAAAHVGSTTRAPPPGLTFTYTPADIQGLAEPRNGCGGIQVAAQPPHHHSVRGHNAHLVQAQQQSIPQQVQASASPRMHTDNSSGIPMSAGGRTSKKRVIQVVARHFNEVIGHMYYVYIYIFFLVS